MIQKKQNSLILYNINKEDGKSLNNQYQQQYQKFNYQTWNQRYQKTKDHKLIV